MAIDTLWMTTLVPMHIVVSLLGIYTVEVTNSGTVSSCVTCMIILLRSESLPSQFFSLGKDQKISPQALDAYLLRSTQITKISLRLNPWDSATLRRLQTIVGPGNAIFPSLRSVTMDVRDEARTIWNPTLELLRASPLASFSLVIPSGRRIDATQITTLLPSTLRHLSLWGPRPPPTSQLLWFKELRTLSISTTARFPNTWWKTLALACPYLTELELYHLAGRPTVEVFEEHKTLFPCLDSLLISDESQDGFLPGTILSSTFPALKSVSLVQSRLPVTDVHQMVKHLRQTGSRLKELTLHLCDEAISAVALKPLEAQDLLGLNLSTDRGFQLGCDGLEELLLPSPHLESLELYLSIPGIFGNTAHSVPFTTFVALARICGKTLRHLAVSVTEPESSTSPLYVFHALTSLHLTVFVRDTAANASFAKTLAVMCPRLDSFYVDVVSANIDDGPIDSSIDFEEHFWKVAQKASND